MQNWKVSFPSICIQCLQVTHPGNLEGQEQESLAHPHPCFQNLISLSHTLSSSFNETGSGHLTELPRGPGSLYHGWSLELKRSFPVARLPCHHACEVVMVVPEPCPWGVGTKWFSQNLIFSHEQSCKSPLLSQYSACPWRGDKSRYQMISQTIKKANQLLKNDTICIKGLWR